MKTLLTFLLTITTSLLTFAQSNKPEKGFGLAYGINFFNNTSHSVRFTHWTKKNIEYGGEVTFYYNKNKSVIKDSVFINTIDGSTNLAVRTNTTTDSRFGVGINPFVLYHFPTKNNLDLFVGGILPIGVNSINGNFSVERVVDIPNYFVSELRKQMFPKQINAGLQFTAGTNYFFYDNLAIGASFRLGYVAGFSVGKTITLDEYISSGSNNPYITSQSIKSEAQNSTTTTYIGFNGSALFTLSYYFSRDKVGKAKE